MVNTVKKLFFVSCGLIGITVVFGLMLIGSVVFADDSVIDQISIDVPVACTISGTGMNTHNANINNGLYENNIGSTILHAFCNDNEGFAIYAAGYTGDEVGGTNSNKLVGTTASGNATIESGIATSAGNPDVSNWAMKLTITQDSGDTTGTNAFTIDSAPNVALPSQAESGATQASFSNYHVVPNEYVKVAHKNSGTDMTDITGGVKLTTTYAAYISKTQPADTYSGQVVYTMVHPASAAAPAVPVSCNPTGTTIGTNSSTDIKCMQDFANMSDTQRNNIIESMPAEAQYSLIDKRDGKTYTIAKYLTKYYDETAGSDVTAYDVWMTKNLDLVIDANTTYTNEDTDLGYNTTTKTYDTASWTPIRSTYAPTSGHIHEWCQGGTLFPDEYEYEHDGNCQVNDTPESYDPGDVYWNMTESEVTDWDTYYYSCDYSASTPSCDQSVNPINTYVSSTGTEQYHLGNYYNWAAAVASNDSSVYTYAENVEQSICPAGWTLPRSYMGEDTVYSLWYQYGFDMGSYEEVNGNGVHDVGERALWTTPLYFAAAGHYDGSLSYVGYDGYFWNSVGNDGVADAALFKTDGDLNYDNGYGQNGGYSIRCILRPVTDSAPY